MKKIKIAFLFASLLVFSAIQSYSQKLNRSQFVSLNNYIDYLNFSSNELINEFQCLYDYYNRVENFRIDPKKTYGLSNVPVCAGDDASFYFEKAIKESKNLNKEDAEKLNSDLNKINETYLSIIKDSRELEIYNRLNDYEKDNFAKHELLMKEIQSLFDDFYKYECEFNKGIFSVYRKYQPYLSSNIHQNYENEMRTILMDEKYFFDSWLVNFERSYFTQHFPVNEWIENINMNDTKYDPFDSQNTLKYPINNYYSMFWGGLKMLQSTKRNAIDGYTFKTDNDAHLNHSLKNIYDLYNSSLVNNFNHYVSACEQQAIYLLKYPVLVPCFYFDKSEKERSDIILKKLPEPLYSPLKIDIQTKPITKEIASALNNYVEYINQESKKASERPRLTLEFYQKLTRYNAYSDDQIKKLNPSSLMLLEDVESVLSFYVKAINDSRYLPAIYKENLNAQTEGLKIICDNRKVLTFQVNLYFQNKLYLNDHFEKAFGYIKEFNELWNEFDKRAEHLYQTIEKIYRSYPLAMPDHAWQISGDVLSDILKQNEKLLKDAKMHYLLETSFSLTGDSIDELCRQALIDEYENLKALRKLGRNNGHCPYTPYEDIPEDSRFFSTKYLKQKSIETDTVIIGKYQEFVRLYNNIAEDYNKFVWLAKGEYETAEYEKYPKIWLLQAMYESDIFKLPEPENKKIIDHVVINSDLFGSMDGYAENNLILLLDVSQSMNKPEKLPLLQNSFKKLLTILRPEDYVGIVIYSGDAQIMLKPTSCSEKEKISEILEKLDGSGTTNIEQGLETAYKLAQTGFIKGGNNRIILATDGEFEISPKMNKSVKKYAEDEIYLTVFHFGKDKGKKISLYELSQYGKGNYEIITQANSDEKLVKEAKAVKKI
jgi:hypothetical protein